MEGLTLLPLLLGPVHGSYLIPKSVTTLTLPALAGYPLPLSSPTVLSVSTLWPGGPPAPTHPTPGAPPGQWVGKGA